MLDGDTQKTTRQLLQLSVSYDGPVEGIKMEIANAYKEFCDRMRDLNGELKRTASSPFFRCVEWNGFIETTVVESQREYEAEEF
jgi:hypothetical protein